MNGAQLIADTLKRAGVGSVFSLAGASHAFLLNELDRVGIRIVSSRHESGAITAADGYSRITGNIGVALVISDQGLPNAIGGLAVAYTACSPVLVLVAAPPLKYLESQPLIDQHKHELTAPITKSAKTVACADRLADSLGSALTQAQSGRPGPVVLMLPQDLMTASVPQLSVRLPASSMSAPAPDPEAIETAAQWLSTATRPLIINGSGACRSGANQNLQALGARMAIPATGNGLGRGVVPEDGITGFSWPYAQYAANQADVVLIVGARLTQRLGLGLPPRFSPEARFIQIDIHAEEAHRNRLVDLFIHADADHAVQALLSCMDKQTPDFDTGRADWLRQALKPRFEALAKIKSMPSEPIHSLRLGQALAKRLPDDAICVSDGADIAAWMYGAIEIQQAPGFMDHYPMGAMGTGTALAIGACAAAADDPERNRRVFLVTGDGALGFYPAELHAAVLAGFNLVVVVGNDGAWGTEVHEQERVIGRAINTRLGALPYEKLAEGLGMTGLRATTEAELESALDQAMECTGPVLINVLTDPESGALLKQDRRVRMIEFSDILEGFKDKQAS